MVSDWFIGHFGGILVQHRSFGTNRTVVTLDKREIAVLNLTGSAKLCYQGYTELHEEGTTWQSFKSAFRCRYEDVHMDQFPFMKLQAAKEEKKESPQEFEDRCRGLAHKIMFKAFDPLTQSNHRENGERMFLASFVSHLTSNKFVTRVRSHLNNR